MRFREEEEEEKEGGVENEVFSFCVFLDIKQKQNTNTQMLRGFVVIGNRKFFEFNKREKPKMREEKKRRGR